MMEIEKRGGLQSNFTNHSGKRPGATELFDVGIDEQEIMERTRHRSVKSVRAYERRSTYKWTFYKLNYSGFT